MCCGGIGFNSIITSSRHMGCYNPLMMGGVGFTGASCFGWGYGGCCGDTFNTKPMMFGIGMGIGCGLGALLVNNFPAICKGVGQAATWVWNKAFPAIGKGIGQAASWMWNKAFPAIGKGIGQAATWVWNKAFPAIGKGVASAAKWVWGGIKSVGKAIGSLFKKKSPESAEASS